jgi:DNA-binding NtrC family response regulator
MAAFLLADGDRNFRRALEIALRLEGAEVATADSAAEALVLLHRVSFDLVVVDTLLADADRLLELTTAAGLLTVAVGPHAELLVRAARLHHVPTLEKPFDAAALLAHARAEGGDEGAGFAA